ncbi:MAG: tRNA lysidine(34) synthetase TilS, partial [Synergistales bacterium]|nr:tRNA lysidine(34) synthetase TilS [Synergistales bacterium]
KHDASFVATAHTADDVAETVFMNLARGTGPFGLAGIPERREHYIRPLISFYREELRKILRTRDICWCEDETNEDVSYLRNRVRIEVLPWLAERINPKIKEHLVALASQMQSVKESERGIARNLIDWIRKDLPFSMLSLDHNSLRKLSRDTLSMVIRESGTSLGLSTLSRSRTENLLDLIETSGRWRFQWEGSVELFAGQGYITFADRTVPGTCISGPVDLSPEYYGRPFSWNNWHFEIQECYRPFNIPTSGSNSATMSLYEEGLQIMSVDTHLSSFGYDTYAKIVPWWLRKVWPVFCLGSTISWLPFYGLAQVNDQARPSQARSSVKITVIMHKMEGCS